MALSGTPGVDIFPSPERVALSTNYLTNFSFANQYLPDTYEKEFERYGNRSVSGFLRMVGAEMPSTSDLIKWSERWKRYSRQSYLDVDVAYRTANFWLPKGTNRLYFFKFY
jgi:hypothetical protein